MGNACKATYVTQQEQSEKPEHRSCCSSSACCSSQPCRGKNIPPNGGNTKACSLRVIAVNDVYLLDNFANLKTLISEESRGWKNVVTTLAGDFLAPSLLSSLDHGVGTIKVLNQLPIDYVCFGNHEADLPYRQLVQRIGEFKGTWVNSNMPDFEPALPPSSTKVLIGEDGKQGARKVAFIGLCIGGGRFQATYRENAFGGAAATMVPVIDAAKIAYEELHQKDQNLDMVIPITHQDMPEDTELAKSGLFPLVIAGHDHEVMLETHGESTIVKAGMDVHNVAVIDLVWGADAGSKPSVTVTMKETKDYKPDVSLAAMIHAINKPCRELETAMIYELSAQEVLSSVNAKFGDSTMVRLVATGIRNSLDCDAAAINSGAVRGNKQYAEGVSYGDLQRECPYPSPMVVVPMPAAVLRDAVRLSRRPWWDLKEGETAKEGASALQLDYDAEVDSDHWLTKISGSEPDPDILYDVACDTRVLRKNDVFKEYIAKFPQRIPPDDAGRPVLPILVDYFCGLMWDKLFSESTRRAGMSSSGGVAAKARKTMSETDKIHTMFEMYDVDHNGQIDTSELRNAIRLCVGERLCSNVVVEQMIASIDVDGNGKVSEAELKTAIQKIHHVQQF